MASSAVFDTPELLEAFLLSLPMKDLLFAQAVCRQWKAAIDNSPNLQRALFFRPATNDVAFCHRRWFNSKGETTRKPLRCELSAADFFYLCTPKKVELVEKLAASQIDYPFSRPLEYREWSAKHNIEHLRAGLHAAIVTKTRVFLNPMLVEFKWFRAFVRGNTNLLPFKIKRAPGSSARRKAQAPADRAEASWRRMLISQPPLARLHDPFTYRYWEGKVAAPIAAPELEQVLRYMVWQNLWVTENTQFEFWTNASDLAQIGVGPRPHGLATCGEILTSNAKTNDAEEIGSGDETEDSDEEVKAFEEREMKISEDENDPSSTQD